MFKLLNFYSAANFINVFCRWNHPYLNGQARLTVRVVTVLALATASTVASAQAWAFDQVRRQAIDTHPSILAKHSSSLATKADLDTASWQRYPLLSLEAAQDSNGNTGNSTVLRVQQPIWAGGRITAGINAAQFKHDAAEIAIEETKQDITLKVIAAYTEAIRQQKRQEYAAKSVKAHERLLDLISRRVEQEVSPRVDKDLAQSRLYQATNDLSAITQSLTAAYTQLSQLANNSINSVSDLEADTPAVPDSKDRALKQAVEHSPTLLRLAAEEAAAGEDVESKRSVYWPQLALRYENIRGQAPGQLNDSRVLLVLDAQPGAGLSAKSNVEAANARQQSALYDREAALRDIREKISLDWNELTAARTRYQNAVLDRTVSTEVFDSYTRQYTTGRKTWIDVLNAIREATLSELALADAGSQIMGAALRLKLLTGNLPLAGGAN